MLFTFVSVLLNNLNVRVAMNACNGCLFQAAQSSIKINLLSRPTSIYHVKFEIQKRNCCYFCQTADFIRLLNGFPCSWEATELILGYSLFIVEEWCNIRIWKLDVIVLVIIWNSLRKKVRRNILQRVINKISFLRN